MQSARLKAAEASGVYVTRVELSIGALDLFRFLNYDHAFPRHSHDRFTVGVFGPQNGTIRFRGGDWQAREGSILAIPPMKRIQPIRSREVDGPIALSIHRPSSSRLLLRIRARRRMRSSSDPFSTIRRWHAHLSRCTRIFCRRPIVSQLRRRCC
jgi:AraC-like ligand binding domain.